MGLRIVSFAITRNCSAFLTNCQAQKHAGRGGRLVLCATIPKFWHKLAILINQWLVCAINQGQKETSLQG